MDVIIYILIFIVLSVLISLHSRKKNILKLRREIHEQFGKKPQPRKYDYECLSYHWDEFKKSVPEDEKLDDITWNDLEMNKIFARINNCKSFAGEQILYSMLHCLPKDRQYTKVLEDKINFFLDNEKEREEIQLLLCRLGKSHFSYYMAKFMAEPETFEIQGKRKYRTMQVLLGLSLLMAIILRNPVFLFSAIVIFILNTIIYTVGKSRYEVHMDTLGTITGIMIFGNKVTDTNRFSYEKVFHDMKKEADLFKTLSRNISGLKSRRDAKASGDLVAILYDYIIGGTLLDFSIYSRILKELKEKKKEFMSLFHKIGMMDMAISIASFRKSLPMYCTPTFHGEHAVKMEDIYHPLIDNPVCNTVNMNKSCIITGSNASGKSTFIKAVALNVILAQSIHTCMAKTMAMPFASVITSMAVTDDLMKGESYYIKEIKYLNRIVQNLKDDRLIICVIDEILRGTNAEERIGASVAILNYLNERNCLAVVATHDLELTKLLSGKYDNYYFCEQMHDNDITFDYKIRDGVSTSKNAIKLLKYVGFPEKIINEANSFIYIKPQGK